MDRAVKKANNPNSELTKNTDPLAAIELTDKTQDQLLAEAFGQSVLEEVPIIGKIISFLDSYQEKLNAVRLNILLQEYQGRFEDTAQFQEAVRKLFTTNAGLALFQKVVRIVNADNYDMNYIRILAVALKRISDSDFKILFDKHNYVLSQIERLSPQALLILSEKSQWPTVKFSSTTMSGMTTARDWDVTFAREYTRAKGITDPNIQTRIEHALNDLKNSNLIVLRPNPNNIELTSIGQEVYAYISPTPL